MSKGQDRREVDLENLEAEFLEALAEAKKAPKSAYISEKMGKRRGGADALDVKLFTLESKIERMREKLGLPKFEVPLKKPEAGKGTAPAGETWPGPPRVEATIYPLDPRDLWNELEQSGREPTRLYARVKCAGAKSRQGADQPSWRLAMVECGDGRPPAKLTLTLFPLPDTEDGELASRKLHEALNKLVLWSEQAVETPSSQRPRLLHVTYTRATRELAFSAR